MRVSPVLQIAAVAAVATCSIALPGASAAPNKYASKSCGSISADPALVKGGKVKVYATGGLPCATALKIQRKYWSVRGDADALFKPRTIMGYKCRGGYGGDIVPCEKGKVIHVRPGLITYRGATGSYHWHLNP